MSKYTTHEGFSQRLNVPVGQSSAVTKGTRHVTMKIPSATTPSWGGYFVIPIRERGATLESVRLEFTISALTGLTVSSSGTAAYLPTFLWATRIDLYRDGQLIESIPGMANFLQQQLFAPTDEKRTMLNASAGLYSSHSSRATKSASSDTWYLNIPAFWNQSSVPLVGNSDLELRIQMAALADSYSLTSGSTATGTVVSTFSSCNAVCTFNYMPQAERDYTTALIRKTPLHYPFLDLQQGTFTLTSGSTAYSLVLNSITGYVSSLIFVIRSSSPANANQITYTTTLSNFEITSSGGENITGGQTIGDQLSRLVMGRQWLSTTFLNDGAGVYFYSFALDPLEAWYTGQNMGGYQFVGSEVLKLTFSSSLGSNAQVDCYALTHAALELGANGSMKKIALSQ